MSLAKLAGVGAGRNAGLPLVHGKAVLLALARRKFRISSHTRFKRIKTHQHLKLQFQLHLLPPMQKGLLKGVPKLGDCLIQPQRKRKLWLLE